MRVRVEVGKTIEVGIQNNVSSIMPLWVGLWGFEGEDEATKKADELFGPANHSKPSGEPGTIE